MTLRTIRRTLAVALLATALLVVTGQSGAQAGNPQIVDHKFFPLVPGTKFHYTSDQGKTVTVTVRNKAPRIIQGHRSQRVDTKEFENGQLTEEFHDWYFQGAKGIVYYMKHTSRRSYENWEAGQDGAEKGIFLPAHPHVGDVWKQTKAPNAGREGRNKAEAYSVSDKTLKIKISSYAPTSSKWWYGETVRFYYTAGKGLTMIKDKDETTTLKSVDKP